MSGQPKWEGLMSSHLCHILLVKNKCQVLPTFKEWGWVLLRSLLGPPIEGHYFCIHRLASLLLAILKVKFLMVP